MCRTGGFVERGIKGHHGYGSERFRLDPRFAIALPAALGDVGVLLEPTSVVAKAFDHAERIGHRARFEPRVALITGAGPIGLLAALLACQRGLETHVVDLVTEGAKPELVAELGAEYHSTAVSELPIAPDIVIECTGLGQLAVAATRLAAPGAVVALTGISHSDRVSEAHPDVMNKALVLGNKAVFGTVNAARRHYDQAATALAAGRPRLAGEADHAASAARGVARRPRQAPRGHQDRDRYGDAELGSEGRQGVSCAAVFKAEQRGPE